jgi:hypothetical protein
VGVCRRGGADLDIVGFVPDLSEVVVFLTAEMYIVHTFH